MGGTNSSLAITVMMLVGSLVVGGAEGTLTSVLERGDVVGSSLITFDTTTSVWNDRMGDKHCLVKKINNGVGRGVGSMCTARRGDSKTKLLKDEKINVVSDQKCTSPENFK